MLSNAVTPLSSEDAPNISEVGGKGASLIRLSQAGFSVPHGWILPVHFFDVWTSAVSDSDAWRQVTRVSPTDLVAFTAACENLKNYALSMSFTAAQLAVIHGFTAEQTSFAVRSSAPEEDLADGSFAGLYETLLNVSSTELPDAIRHCYVSCLDARVLLYRHKLGMAAAAPRIAVLVQAQLNSDASGVAFSLNPLNNDYDECVVNATFGLGEALVSGDITPDSWTVNKVDHGIVSSSLGTKGGDHSATAALTDDQLREVVQTAVSVETLFAEPVDVEWAFAEGAFFVLQARPITTYIPIPEAMMTEPGEPRVLYMDESLADGITISGPVSTITNDYFLYLADLALSHLDKKLDIYLPPKENLIATTDIRIYTNITNIMRWTGLEGIAASKRVIDVTYADILEKCDLDGYRGQKVGLTAKLRVVPLFCRILWALRQTIGATVSAVFRPTSFQRRYHERLAEFDGFLREPIPARLPVDGFLLHYALPFLAVSQVTTVPALALYVVRGTYGLTNAIDAKSDRQVALAEAIKSGSEDIVMVMGLQIYELATLLDGPSFDDLERLAREITERTADASFLDCWDRFIERFGCRGPLEMDLSHPKYADDPMVALRQIASVDRSSSFDPREHHRLLQENRHQAYTDLRDLLPKRKQAKLKRAYRAICDYEHSRELPKDHLVTIQKRFREYLLRQASIWVREERLDNAEQVFDLRVQEILAAQNDAEYDLRSALAGRDPYVARARRVRHFPHAIDSRGRILRPEARAEPGQLVGTAVSSGVAIGPVKVMHDPFEKVVEAGDVLVAYTTDPGWTPLFINAAAILLEVGGELQHGALVAREYGKPCIAGIVNATSDLEDGQMVEVDGTSGHVRLL